MQNTVFSLFLIVLVSAPALASPHGGKDQLLTDLMSSELEAVANEAGDQRLSELTVDDIVDIAGRLSVREQEARYVRSLAVRSFILPGLGQLRGGDPLAGSLFLAGDLALTVGTLWGAYALLPESVQIRRDDTGLDYFGDSRADIREAWEELSFRDLAPSLGVVVGGAVVDLFYRSWSSSHARDLALDNIESGSVTFEPRPFEFIGGRLGFGMSMRY